MGSGLALIIPAAGRGTRMRTVDPMLPKELLPLNGKPVIQYAIEEGLDIKADKIIVVLSFAKPKLREFLGRLDAPIEIEYQTSPTGEADAIALAEPLAGSGCLAVIYPDNVFLPGPGVLRHLLAVHRRYDHDVVALTAVTRANQWATTNSGKVQLRAIGDEVYRVKALLAKSPGRFQRTATEELRACGIAVHGAHLFDDIRRARRDVADGEFTDRPVRALISRERGLLGARVPGTVFDLGDPLGYRFCESRFKRPQKD
ncbi:MAG: NTP transferase domain-containing protein [Gammaproteobacteria bacterium]|nr:NTP transferase domain-containing protein [Gammaproteobacteria bacterium]